MRDLKRIILHGDKNYFGYIVEESEEEILLEQTNGENIKIKKKHIRCIIDGSTSSY